MGDVRAELFSGEPAKQTGALMNALAALAAGRDVAPLVSAALQLLGNPATAPEVKRAAYDLALTATTQLSDAGAHAAWARVHSLGGLGCRQAGAGCAAVRRKAATHCNSCMPMLAWPPLHARPTDLARLAAAVHSDLQRGSPHEVRLKALAALPGLPGHRLASLLGEGNVLERLVSEGAGATGERPALPGAALSLLPAASAATAAAAPPGLRPPPDLQVLSLRSTHGGVRAAAIEAAADLTPRAQTLVLAAESPAVLSALLDLWEGVTDALTGAPLLAALGGRAMQSAALQPTSAIQTAHLAPAHPRTPPALQTRQTWCAPPPVPRWRSCFRTPIRWARPAAPRCRRRRPPCYRTSLMVCTSGWEGV